MRLPPSTFWTWFSGFARRLPADDPPDALLDELLDQLHAIDRRIYFELSTNTADRELILTASGNSAAFPVVDNLIATAPKLKGWSFVALKPPKGFQFKYRSGDIVLNVRELWFMPLQSNTNPRDLGLRLCLPNADYILERQTVDTAYTILETVIGERSCATDIQYVEVDELPADPAAERYLPITRLVEYLEWRRRKHSD
jgi:hypothetical protein